MENKENGLKILLFGKPGCTICPLYKQTIENCLSSFNLSKEEKSKIFVYYDASTQDGMREATLKGALSKIPMAIVEKNKVEIARFYPWDQQFMLKQEKLKTILEQHYNQ